MKSHELANKILDMPNIEVTASTDISDKAIDDDGSRVYSSDLCEVVLDCRAGYLTIICGIGESNV